MEHGSNGRPVQNGPAEENLRRAQGGRLSIAAHPHRIGTSPSRLKSRFQNAQEGRTGAGKSHPRLSPTSTPQCVARYTRAGCSRARSPPAPPIDWSQIPERCNREPPTASAPASASSRAIAPAPPQSVAPDPTPTTSTGTLPPRRSRPGPATFAPAPPRASATWSGGPPRCSAIPSPPGIATTLARRIPESARTTRIHLRPSSFANASFRNSTTPLSERVFPLRSQPCRMNPLLPTPPAADDAKPARACAGCTRASLPPVPRNARTPSRSRSRL